MLTLSVNESLTFPVREWVIRVAKKGKKSDKKSDKKSKKNKKNKK